MWPAILEALRAKSDLSIEQIDFAFNEMLSEEVNPQFVKEFLELLKIKGESAHEVQRATEVILSKATPFPYETFSQEITIDTCGTGGDGLHTLNISTMVALVVAASGTTVFKHGNRAASSKSGSADVLEAMGISVNPGVDTILRSAQDAKIAFLFAQAFHPALRFVAPIRRELGFRTVFNFLGPLVNPARPNTQIVGVSEVTLANVVATSLAARGVKAIVLRGQDGLDEVSIASPTEIWVALNADQGIRHLQISPETFGEKPQSLELIRGGEPESNANAIVDLVEGKATDAVNSAVAMNAACALVAIDAHTNEIGDIETSLHARYLDAQDIIRSKKVSETLELWKALQR